MVKHLLTWDDLIWLQGLKQLMQGAFAYLLEQLPYLYSVHVYSNLLEQLPYLYSVHVYTNLMEQLPYLYSVHMYNNLLEQLPYLYSVDEYSNLLEQLPHLYSVQQIKTSVTERALKFNRTREHHLPVVRSTNLCRVLTTVQV